MKISPLVHHPYASVSKGRALHEKTPATGFRLMAAADAGAAAPADTGPAGQKEKEIASRYDLTRITYAEKEALAKELYDSGAITFLEMGLMTQDKALKDHFNMAYNEHDTINFLDAQQQYLAFLNHSGNAADSITQTQEQFVAKLVRFDALKRA